MNAHGNNNDYMNSRERDLHLFRRRKNGTIKRPESEKIGGELEVLIEHAAVVVHQVVAVHHPAHQTLVVVVVAVIQTQIQVVRGKKYVT